MSLGLTYWKPMMLSTLFLSIDRVFHIDYTFRGLWGNNLGNLLAFYFELIVFKVITYIYFNIFQYLSLGIVVILLAVCLVSSITTGSFSMRMQQSLFKRKWRFAQSRITLTISFSAVQSAAPVYTTNGCAPFRYYQGRTWKLTIL